MKKTLVLSLLILPILFLGGCSSIDKNDDLVDTEINQRISQLEIQISGLNSKLNSLKDVNFKLIALLSEKGDIIEEASKSEVDEVEIVNPDIKISSSRLEFKNDIYGFKLELPKIRQGYISRIQGNKIIFGFSEQKNLFTITMLTHSEYDVVKQDLMGPRYLGENDKYVFVYSIAQDAVSQKIADRMGKINSILKTFQIFDR